ncbi:MAG TPA: bestrophin family ion channel [Allocoleopsis sp.]
MAFVLFGIEEIGIEIENPFGCDPNDLPLDTLCDGIRNYVDEAIKNNA